MPDFRVRFVGDLGNLGQFNSAINSALSSNQNILSQANSSVASRTLGGANINPAGSRTEGFQIRNGLAEIDRYNQALIQSGQVVRQFISGYRAEINSLGNYQATPIFGEAYHTDFRLAIHNLVEYERLLAGLGPVDTLIRQKQYNAATTAAAQQNAEQELRRFTKLQSGNLYNAAEKDAELASLRASLDRAVPGVSRIIGLPAPGAYSAYEADQARFKAEQATFKAFQGSAAQALGAPPPPVPVAPTVIKPVLDQRLLRLGYAEIENQVRAADLKARAEINRIANSPLVLQYKAAVQKSAITPSSFLNKDEATVLEKYPLIQKDLIQKAGLGTTVLPTGQRVKQTPGTGAFYEAVSKQEFKVNSITRDMDRGLTRISGSLRDANGLMNEFSYTVKANGQVVNTWGRQLSGARGILGNTGRDVLKFTEWMIAATVVMGAFGAVTGIFTVINTLNAELTRFGITARLSGEETNKMFKGLAEVAFNTATPIEELVKAADDMALATRRANQSTQEWHASILELANAVGILTNISGLDTVRATELLVAAMKQLDLATSDLVPLLNQITAAAGGQSGSITDIATALGGLAEAASEAGISVTSQIAAVQVISQVTGKSADQVATAFKNLFGSIAADASVKKLDEFGIAVKDANGNLRPFLEIYRDIQDAITGGLIPAGRINEVIRAIAGGPRRAPDASALLNNIYKVFEVEKIAVNASNEALIANAKILDTNQAKLVQLQNVFKTDVFERLNDTMQKLVSTLVDLGTMFSGIFGTIPSEVYAVIVQILALGVVSRLLIKTWQMLSATPFLAGFLNQAKNVTNAVTAVGTAAKASSAALNGPSPIQYIGRVGPYSPAPIPRTAGLTGLLSTDQQMLLIRQRAAAGTLDPAAVRSTPLLSRGVRTTGATIPALPIREGGRFTSWQNVTPLWLTRNITDEQRFRGGLTPPSKAAETAFGKADLSAKEIDQRLGIAAKESSGIANTLRRFASSLKGKFAIGGAIGGAAVLGGRAAGGDVAGTLGNISQIAGIGLLATPLAPVGAGLLGASFLLQGIGEESNKAKERVIDLQKSLYDLGQQFKQDTANVSATSEALENIQNTLTRTVKGTEEYIDLQKQLGSASLEAATALEIQRATVEQMGVILEKLDFGKDSEQWATILSSANRGNLSGPDYDKIVQRLSESILEASGQAVFNPERIGFTAAGLNYGPADTGTVGRLRGRYGNNDIDILDLIDRPELVTQFIGRLGTSANFPVNPLTEGIYRGALEAVKPDIGDEEFKSAVEEFGAYVEEFGGAGPIIQNALASASARQQALSLLGGLYGPNLENAQAREAVSARLLDVYNQMPETILNRRRRENVPNAARERVSQLIEDTRFARDSRGNQILNLSKISAKEAKAIADEAFKNITSTTDASKSLYEELADDPDRLAGAYSTFWRNMEVDIKGVTDVADNFGDIVNEAMEKAKAAVLSFSESLRAKGSTTLLELQARTQAGEFKDDPGELRFLTEQAIAFEGAAAAINEAESNLAASTDQGAGAIGILTAALIDAKVNGFAGIEQSIEGMNAALLNWIVTLNLSGPQIVKLIGLIAQAFALASKAAYLSTSIQKAAAAGVYPGSAAYQSANVQKELDAVADQIRALGLTASGPHTKAGGGTAPTPGSIFLTEEQRKQADVLGFVQKSVADAFKLQAQIPGEAERNKSAVVAIFDGLEKIYQARGVSEELLRKALEENTAQLEQMNTKADTIQRIRVGAGSFAALANVPINATSGVSVGSPQGPITINLNINGQLITPAQFDQLANKIGAVIKSELANG